MSFTYAVGDLHGRLDVLDAILARLAPRDAGKIVFLGDYIDRGPDSRAVVEKLMAGSQDHHEWVMLKGNHEDLALKAHDGGPDEYYHWFYNCGGKQTCESYDSERSVNRLPEEHLEWMKNLPALHVDDHRLFVHAGIRKGQAYDMLDEAVLMWVRHQRDEETPCPRGKHIVHGHTPYENGPIFLKSRTNLDTLAYRTGRAVVAIFDDEIAGGPADTFEVRCGYAVKRVTMDSE